MQSRCTFANVSSIGASGQKKLSLSCVAIAGLGGVGSIAFEMLLRAGVGKLKIADHGFFEESNANRQVLWSKKSDGILKTKAALEFAKGINPNVKIECFDLIDGKNAAKFASGASCVIDATDKPHSRISVWRGAKENRIPYIFASALKTTGMLTVFHKRDFEKEFGISGKKHGNFLTCDNALGPVSNTIGCLASQQAINIILKKPLIQFPSILSFNAFSSNPIVIHKF
jgi:molybdopterin-synthase adenylyltransferase